MTAASRGKDIRVRASAGGEFDCYLALPGGNAKYMMPGNAKAFDAKVRAFSMGRALGLLAGLRGAAD